MNIPLLRRIQRQIDKAPERFAMRSAAVSVDCGTAYCIGGWAKVLSGCVAVANIGGAYELLEISSVQGHRLFWTHHWPEQFQAPDGTPELPALAIARIDHFIATEGRE